MTIDRRRNGYSSAGSRVNMPHETDVTIRWGDTDAGGLIYYPRFFHFTIVGLNEYFAPAFDGGHAMERFRKDGHALPAVEASASFRSPLRAGDRVTIETTIVDVGESSFTAASVVRRSGEAEPAASLDVSFVFVDEAFESQPLPAAMRDCIERRGDS